MSDNSHPPVPPPQWGEESRFSQRLTSIEGDIRNMQRDVGRLEGQYSTLTAGLTDVRTEIAGLATDIKWIRETLLAEVKKAGDRAGQAYEAASGGAKAAKGDGNVSKALGVIAILAATIAAAFGLESSMIHRP